MKLKTGRVYGNTGLPGVFLELSHITAGVRYMKRQRPGTAEQAWRPSDMYLVRVRAVKMKDPAPTRKELEAWALKHTLDIISTCYDNKDRGFYVSGAENGEEKPSVYLALLSYWRKRPDLR